LTNRSHKVKKSENKPPQSDAANTIPDDPEQSVYRFIIVAAKRARQLQTGARPKVQQAARKLTRVALDEVRRGLIPYSDAERDQTAPEGEEEPSEQ